MTDKNTIAQTRLIRLVYYNDALLSAGILTQREHQRMNNAILSKYGKDAPNTKSALPRIGDVVWER